jgi:hypothetical protein
MLYRYGYNETRSGNAWTNEVPLPDGATGMRLRDFARGR